MGNQSSNEILFRLVSQKNEEEVLKVLQNGGNVNSISRTGVSLMRAALEKSLYSVYKFCLVHHAIMLPCLGLDQTPLHRTVSLNHYKFACKLIRNQEVLQTQLNACDDLGRTPLHIAVEIGSSDLVALLLKYNANRNLRNKDFKTPYDLAIESQTEMADEIIEQLSIEDYLCKVTNEDISPIREQGSTQDTTKIILGNPAENVKAIERAVKDFRVPVIRSEELKLLELFSRGSSCLVFKGKWRGTEVAIKQFTVDYSESEKKLSKFIKELQVISQVRHPNLLMLMGICIDQPNLCIITELVQNSTLFYAIHKNKQKQLNLSERFSISIQIGKGLAYLHANDPPIIHRDLKPENCLLENNMNVKIADFGLARPASTFIHESTTTCIGTTRFMAPELFDKDRIEKIGVEIDIWAYGCMLIEIFSNKRPWSYIPSSKINNIFYELYHKKPIPIPSNIPEEIAEIISECCRYNPKRRPPVSQILSRLESVKQLLSPS